jgi:hypothetical protein
MKYDSRSGVPAMQLSFEIDTLESPDYSSAAKLYPYIAYCLIPVRRACEAPEDFRHAGIPVADPPV